MSKEKECCNDHQIEVLHQEARDGQVLVVMGCRKCGEFKEYKMAVKAKKFDEELNFSARNVV